jgi:hypothetical protein
MRERGQQGRKSSRCPLPIGRRCLGIGAPPFGLRRGAPDWSGGRLPLVEIPDAPRLVLNGQRLPPLAISLYTHNSLKTVDLPGDKNRLLSQRYQYFHPANELWVESNCRFRPNDI